MPWYPHSQLHKDVIKEVLGNTLEGEYVVDAFGARFPINGYGPEDHFMGQIEKAMKGMGGSVERIFRNKLSDITEDKEYAFPRYDEEDLDAYCEAALDVVRRLKAGK